MRSFLALLSGIRDFPARHFDVLFEVRPRDLLVLGTVLSLVATVGLTSAATATLGGLRIDPASALCDD